MGWNDSAGLSRVFSNPALSNRANSDNFALNVLNFLKLHGLSGFDIDWEPPLSTDTRPGQFKLIVASLRAAFREAYTLSLCPSGLFNLDVSSTNACVDLLNIQTYAGVSPDTFTAVGISGARLGYGAKFESGFQTAEEAAAGVKEYPYMDNVTVWRLNSTDFAFEQAQMLALRRILSGGRQVGAPPSCFRDSRTGQHPLLGPPPSSPSLSL